MADLLPLPDLSRRTVPDLLERSRAFGDDRLFLHDLASDTRLSYGEFLACTGYPECKTTRPIPLGVKCPKCKEGDLAERRTKRGRSFFGCSRYPDCDFSTWYRPTPVTCPSCGFVGAEMRSTKARGEYRRCLACETEFAAEEGATTPVGA